jgi:hypothetical protein
VLDAIQGRVTGAHPGSQIVLFARSGVWWLQPEQVHPYTPIQSDSTWRNSTHLGTEYAALLVEAGYHPPGRMAELPAVGGHVLAMITAPGDPAAPTPRHTLQFSGYEWMVRAAPSDRGGRNNFDPANAWTDGRGALHLRIAGAPGAWTCAEVALTRSLGYGTYRFVVRDVSQLDPAAVFSIFTWDGPADEQNHREMAFEVSRWGNAGPENAQFTLQPYYVAGNIARFAAPAGVLTHSLRWESGRSVFRTARGLRPDAAFPPVAEHVFSSGVPSPGNEHLRINLYAFQRGARQLQQGMEVVIERFEYLP